MCIAATLKTNQAIRISANLNLASKLLLLFLINKLGNTLYIMHLMHQEQDKKKIKRAILNLLGNSNRKQLQVPA